MKTLIIWIVLILFCTHGMLNAIELAEPRMQVLKSKRELRLFDGDRLIKTYHVALGKNPVTRKEREGDKATPEGSYFVCLKNPKSKYHLALAISYPGPADAERGFKAGLISDAERKAILLADKNGKTPPWNTKLGGAICVHGNGSKPDWTWGCVALDNPDIEELYRLIPVGTPITIDP